MATSFNQKSPVINQSGSNIVNNTSNPRIPPSANGTRIIPKDAYTFISGAKAIFLATFTDTDKPIQVDTGSYPIATIYGNGQAVEAVQGALLEGQLYEYKFEWDIPADIDTRSIIYNVVYSGYLGGTEYVWGDEYIKISNTPQNIKLKVQAYAVVDELRQDKFNIDSYLPADLATDRAARDLLLQQQLVSASKWLNGQLNLRDFHSSYNDNFNQFTRYYAIWSILGQSMGEEGSAVSDRSLNFWKTKWSAVLKQIKMHSQLSNIPTGRA